MPWIPEKTGSHRESYEFDWDKLESLARIPSGMFSNQQICVAMGWDDNSISLRIKERYGLTFGEYRESLRHRDIADLYQTQLERAQHMKADFGMLRWLGINLLGQSDDPKGIGRHVVVTRCYSNPKRSQGQE